MYLLSKEVVLYLLGIPDTSFRGLRTRIALKVLKSTSMSSCTKSVMNLQGKNQETCHLLSTMVRPSRITTRNDQGFTVNLHSIIKYITVMLLISV